MNLVEHDKNPIFFNDCCNRSCSVDSSRFLSRSSTFLDFGKRLLVRCSCALREPFAEIFVCLGCQNENNKLVHTQAGTVCIEDN